MDEVDLIILDALQENARVSMAEVARRAKLSPKTVMDRIRRMEEVGIIAGYRAKVDAAKLGFPIRAYLLVRAERKAYSRVITLARELPEVREVHHLGDDRGFVMHVVARDMDDLNRLSAAFEPLSPVEALQILTTPVEK